MGKLAIAGGNPVGHVGFHGWPVTTEYDRKGLTDLVKSDNWSCGCVRTDFEKEFASMCGVKHCIAVTNGTVSLELILRGLGIGYGDEVILPPYTFIATFSSVIFAGATPVFADIDRATYNMSPADAERKITPRTKAIIPVAVAGRPIDFDAFEPLAEKYGVKLVIDAAQAVGAAWNNKSICAYGDAASISCQNSKNLTSGEGGIITTNSDMLNAEIRRILNGGTDNGKYVSIGQNHYLGEFPSKLLSTQLKKFPEEMVLREKNAAYLDGRLKQLPFASPTEYDPRITHNAYHLYMMRFAHEVLAEKGVTRDMFLQALNAEGVPLGPGYMPLYTFPCVTSEYTQRIIGGKIDVTPLPECEIASRLEGSWMYQAVLLCTHKDMDNIADALEKVWENTDELRSVLQ